MIEKTTKIEIPKSMVNFVEKQEYFPILYTSFEDFVLDAIRSKMIQLRLKIPSKEIQISTALFNELSERATKQGIIVDDYADQLLRKNMGVNQ